MDITHVTVRLLQNLRVDDLKEVKEKLIDIAADGMLSDDERPALADALGYLEEISKTVSELKTISLMALGETAIKE